MLLRCEATMQPHTNGGFGRFRRIARRRCALFKIRFRKECRFEPERPHQNSQAQLDGPLGSFHPLAGGGEEPWIIGGRSERFDLPAGRGLPGACNLHHRSKLRFATDFKSHRVGEVAFGARLLVQRVDLGE